MAVTESGSEHLYDVPGESVINFCMAWNGLAYAGSRILIPIVPASVPDEDTPGRLDAFQQFFPFHYTAMSS